MRPTKVIELPPPSPRTEYVPAVHVLRAASSDRLPIVMASGTPEFVLRDRARAVVAGSWTLGLRDVSGLVRTTSFALRDARLTPAERTVFLEELFAALGSEATSFAVALVNGLGHSFRELSRGGLHLLDGLCANAGEDGIGARADLADELSRRAPFRAGTLEGLTLLSDGLAADEWVLLWASMMERLRPLKGSSRTAPLFLLVRQPGEAKTESAVLRRDLTHLLATVDRQTRDNVHRAVHGDDVIVSEYAFSVARARTLPAASFLRLAAVAVRATLRQRIELPKLQPLALRLAKV